jgi:6-phosphogluconolactonase/glucosamine-6-phosphate isomerase/deaminase
VAITTPYQQHRRMTLTYPMLNRARRILWLVTGEDKPAMLGKLRAGDPAIPAGRIRADVAEVFADAAAARDL